jgi:hypothetical protein
MIRSLGSVVVLGLGLACAGAPSPEPAPVAAPAPVPAPAPAPADALVSADDPAETVRRVYALYQGEPAARAPWLPAASAQLGQSWGSAVMEAEDACGVPAIFESDVIVDAPAVRLGSVKVEAQKTGETATATARFENFGKASTVRFDLVYEGGAWRIDDVHPSGDSLRKRIMTTVVAGDGC